jgi:hypothetical protein
VLIQPHCVSVGPSAFLPPYQLNEVCGVGEIVKDSGTVLVLTCLVSCQTVFRQVHAMYTPKLTPRSAQQIGRTLTVS